jgi:hypothetical protein
VDDGQDRSVVEGGQPFAEEPARFSATSATGCGGGGGVA